jgi:hypothetical protein
LIAASLGIILLGLLRTPLRWSGAAMALLAAVWAARVPQPDILISADGRNVGVRGQDGRLHLMHAAKGTRDAFLLREWMAADADPRTATDASLTAGVSCDDHGCVMQSAGGAFIAQALRAEALADDCERAALIVTTRPAPAGCAASVIDSGRLRRQGAMALRRSRCQTRRDRPSMVAGRGRRGRRRRHGSHASRDAARHRRDALGGGPAGGRIGQRRGFERKPWTCPGWLPVCVQKTHRTKDYCSSSVGLVGSSNAPR